MFKLYTCLIGCLLGFSFQTIGQVFPAEPLHLSSSGDYDPYIYHVVQPKETLYQLGRQYHTTAGKIKTMNRFNSNKLALNQVLKMPIDPERLAYFIPGEDSGDWVVLYYEVKRKDNLYKICKRELGLNLAVIKEINNLSNNKLHLGQKILLGYYPLFDAKKEDAIRVLPNEEPVTTVITTTIVEASVDSSDVLLFPSREEEKPVQSFVQSDFAGVAYWNKSGSQLSGTYVLSNTVPSGRNITILNPMSGYETEAKVIGKIPENTYEGDMLILVSASVAKKTRCFG